MLGKYRLLAVVVVAATCVDQGSKALALAYLDEGANVPLVAEHLSLTLRRNLGIAWGLGSESSAVVRGLLAAGGLALGAVLLAMFARLSPEERLLRFAAALIMGGGAGNLFDRVRLGHVVDFIAIRVEGGGRSMSGTFNVADVALVVGLALVVLGVTRARRSGRRTAEEDAE